MTDLAVFETVQRDLVEVLRAFEDAQQDIRFQDIAGTQQALRQRLGTTLDDIYSYTEAARNSGAENDVHETFFACVSLLQEAITYFLSSGGWPEFATAYMSSRQRQCQALERLYLGLHNWPQLSAYFSIGDQPTPPSTATAAEGSALTHVGRSDSHHDYSLYVPETYDPQKRYPLIVALHGGYGRGDEYIWTWMRIARSREMILLAPKSVGSTWSIVQPPLDGQSILTAMDSVTSGYSIDSSKILLSGLSDGATFSFLLGLEHADRFAALAPIAGVLSPNVDHFLRAKAALELPIHVVHGVHDAIFPVQTARSFTTLMSQLGYQLKYTELPDWGHALTYRINETLILPWFDDIIT